MSLYLKVRVWLRTQWDRRFIEQYESLLSERVVTPRGGNRGRHWAKGTEHGHTAEFPKVTAESAP